MTTDIIRVPPIDAGPIGVAQGAAERLAKLAAACRLVQRVVSDRTQALAARHAVDARTEIKRLEEARVAVKAPALELCRKIDDIAREAALPLKAEIQRLEKLLSDYHRELERQRLERERQAREEQERQRRDAEAESARLRAEAQAKAAQAATPVQAQQVLDLASAKAKQIEAAAAAPVAVTPVPVAPSGVRTRTVWSYRVVDVWKIAAHNRNLVRIEPAAGAIREMIDSGMRECPGLEIYEETKVGTVSR